MTFLIKSFNDVMAIKEKLLEKDLKTDELSKQIGLSLMFFGRKIEEVNKTFTLTNTTINHSKPSVSEYCKGCVRYIFASLFYSLKKSTCETKKNAFYFTSKALFVLEIIKV